MKSYVHLPFDHVIYLTKIYREDALTKMEKDIYKAIAYAYYNNL